jgi:hypothetical protein
MRSNKQIHISHEVVEDSLKAKLVASAQSSGTKYKYRATALLAGKATVRPYDPIFLKGLPDGMEGMWIVTSVTHIFNKGLPYSMRVTLGSNERLIATPLPVRNSELETSIPIVPEISSENQTFIEPIPLVDPVYVLNYNNYPRLTGNCDCGCDKTGFKSNELEEYIAQIDEITPAPKNKDLFEARLPDLSDVNRTFTWSAISKQRAHKNTRRSGYTSL